MSDYEFSQITRYVNSNSLLVITSEKIVRLFCPFSVRVIIPGGGLNTGEQHKVSKVMMSEKYRLVYLIGGKPYYYALFRIII